MLPWTAAHLTEHTTSLLHDARLILGSNRAPSRHHWHGPTLLEPRGDTPRAAGTTLWDGAWLPQVSAQRSCLLQDGHALCWSQPAGGLTSALDAVMQACHGTWVVDFATGCPRYMMA